MSGFPTRILAATDGSEDAALALRAAADLSSSTGSELHVIQVWPGPPLPVSRHSAGAGLARDDPREHEMKTRELLERQVSRAKVARGLIARKHLREGRPAEEIAELAEELGVGLLLIGSRGLNAVKRLVVGSVSEGVVSLAPCPVLVMRGGEGAWPPSRVVVGDDTSLEAKMAGEVAASLGGLFGAPVLLVGAYLPERRYISSAANRQVTRDIARRAEEYLETRASQLKDISGVRPRVWVVEGYPAAAIQEAVEESGEPTLAAVGRRGLGAVARFALGSVSSDVLRSVTGPVLIVPFLGNGPRRRREASNW
jgi:nucleotide-binding universal stress UspA family protein